MPNPFGGRVKHIQADRKDAAALDKRHSETRLRRRLRQICYLPEEAEEAAKLFANRAGKIVVTSRSASILRRTVQAGSGVRRGRSYELPSPYPAEI